MPDSRRATLKRVLVIRIGRLGDTILATPVIEVLQKSLGADIAIDFVSSPGASAYILGMEERVNRVFPIAHRSIPWRLHPEKRALERHSREHPYDLVINLGREPVVIRRGDRIAQMIVAPVTRAEFREMAGLPDTDRGDGGLGHTGG